MLEKTVAKQIPLYFAAAVYCMLTHVGSPGGHEESEVCEVIAGAGRFIAAEVHRLAAVSGPPALQAIRLILPEGTLRHISFSVYGLQGRERNKDSVNCGVIISFCSSLLWDTKSIGA